MELSSGRKAIDPRRLERFFDKVPITTELHSLDKTSDDYMPKMRYYGATIFDDSVPFFRLGEEKSRVTPLEPQYEGTMIFNPQQTSDIPKSLAQRDYESVISLKTDRPVGFIKEGFKGPCLLGPKGNPEYYEAREGLLLPSERRLANETEIRLQSAQKLAAKSSYDQVRREFIMHNRHNRGVLGLDYPVYNETEVYKPEQNRMKAYYDHKLERASQRHDNLVERSVSSVTHGFHPFHHDINPVPQHEVRMFDKKDDTYRQIYDTHERLIEPMPFQGKNVLREQNLRYRDTLGKNYNIINGQEW